MPRKNLAAHSPAIFEATIPPERDAAASTFGWLLIRFRAESMQLSEKDYTSAWLLLAITGLVPMLACANLANLPPVRGRTREREMAVRRALGTAR